MKKRTKIQSIKLFIKVSIATFLLILFIALGFFVKHTRTFENSNMKKWSTLTEVQRTDTLHRIIPHIDNMDLMMLCMNKIADLPDSSEMIIQSAASLCYNGIKLNEIPKDEEK